MNVRRYWPMLRDLGGIVRTVKGQGGNGAAVFPYQPRQAQRAVERFHVHRLEGRLLAARRETPDTRTLRIAFPPSTLPPFQTGQHFAVHVGVDGFATSRPYTATSPPDWGDLLEVTVKRHPLGLVSPYLVDRLGPGDPVVVSGPDGDDCFNPLRDTDDLLLLAGGSGITAFMTTAERLLAHRPRTRITLAYGNRTAPDIIFRERLEALAARHPDRFRLRLVLSRPGPGWSGLRGHVDGDLVRALLREEAADVATDPDLAANLAHKTVFVCGPPAMNRDLPAALVDLGVPARRVRVASVALPTPNSLPTLRGWPAGLAAADIFTIRLGHTGAPISARADEPLLQSLERAGAATTSCCRTGVCGSCRQRLVEGEVFTAPGFTPRPTDTDSGYIHTCVCYPVSDLTLQNA